MTNTFFVYIYFIVTYFFNILIPLHKFHKLAIFAKNRFLQNWTAAYRYMNFSFSRIPWSFWFPLTFIHESWWHFGFRKTILRSTTVCDLWARSRQTTENYRAYCGVMTLLCFISLVLDCISIGIMWLAWKIERILHINSKFAFMALVSILWTPN